MDDIRQNQDNALPAGLRPKWKKNWFEQNSTKIIWIAVAALLAIGFILGICIARRPSEPVNIPAAVQQAIDGEEGKVTTITQAALQKVVATAKLYTVEYPYNGIASVYDTDNTALKYHVAYEGTVKAGIDISQIQVTLNEETREIIIRLPQPTLEEPVVNAGTMEYIFSKDKYNTETVAQEAYKTAIADLKERAAHDPGILQTATQTAKSAEKAFIEPWVNQVENEDKYTVIVLGYGEEYTKSTPNEENKTNSAANE